MAISPNTFTKILDCRDPYHHEVRVFKADLMILKDEGTEPSDDPTQNDGCPIKGLRAEMREYCHLQKHCQLQQSHFDDYDKYAIPGECDGFSGTKYLMFTYQCRARK